MKIKELVAILSKLPQDTEIILSKDAEGNHFSPLSGFGEGTIRPEDVNNYNIEEYYSDHHSDEDCCLEPGERNGFVKAICLWPMN